MKKICAALLLLLPGPLAAQSLAARLAAAGEGSVRLSFAARPGVCSSGGHGITVGKSDDDDEWESDCERGPVRVSLRMRSGHVAGAETWWAAGGRAAAKLRISAR